MQNDLYTKCFCEFIVKGEIDTDKITQLLDIIPSRSFKKGEKTISERSGSSIVRTHNLWAVSTKNFVSGNGFDDHIAFLKTILAGKIDAIRNLKNKFQLEVVLWIWIETDDAGVGLDIEESDMLFMNSIANRTHFSLITNRES